MANKFAFDPRFFNSVHRFFFYIFGLTFSPGLMMASKSRILIPISPIVRNQLSYRGHLLSERFHISKYYLIHLFNKVFDVSPIQYHQRIRLERAKNMIRHTLMPLQEIADQLGFSGIHAFSRAFKKKVGVSPAGFRKEFRDEHRSESVRSSI
jgi:AraC-like DNA-binding protein